MSGLRIITAKALRAVVPAGARPLAFRAVGELAYRGGAVTCPCCGNSFRAFAPTGVRMRRNARCWRCGSLERHRLLWLYLQDRTGLLHEPLRVLHFAPEACLEPHLRRLPNIAYTTTDLNAPNVTVNADIQDLPFSDGSFDLVLCGHVLEHVPDDRQAMREVHRVLAPGASALILIPVDRNLAATFEDPTIVTPRDRERSFGQVDHVRLYGLDYADRLRAGGFTEVLDDHFARELDAESLDVFRLDSSDFVIRCVKAT